MLRRVKIVLRNSQGGIVILEKPVVFAYHDYKKFLKDMMDYKKESERGFNLKTFGERLGVSSSFLSMMFKDKRDLSLNMVPGIAGVFALENGEVDYLELLINFNLAKADEAKSNYLEKMQSFKKYKDLNPQEVKLNTYMSSWLNVAIREMTALEDFQKDPKWIQARLRFPVNLIDIKRSLDFLISSEIIKKNPDGSFSKPSEQISCLDKVYSNALVSFHRSFLELAGDAVIYADTEERRLLGHVVSMEEENIGKAMDILNEAFEKIRSLQTNNNSGKEVYSIELAFFPLTHGE